MAKFPEEKEQEFQELASYVGFFATEVWGVPQNAPHHPSHFLSPERGKISKSQLLAGLRQATRDTIEASQNFQSAKVEEIDHLCRNNHILTLSEIRRRYGR